MLEELVENERQPPAETALTMLSFIQNDLPAGGTAAEKRFIMLFDPLCHRIFGKILDAKDDYRHKEGGWFSAQTPWTRQSAASRPQQIPNSPRSRLAISAQNRVPDPVVTLLGAPRKPVSPDQLPAPTLIEAISKECENRPKLQYMFPFPGLPKATQNEMLAILASSKGQKPEHVLISPNLGRLFGHLMKFSPTQQTNLLRYRQKASMKKSNAGIHLSPRGFNLPLSPRQSSPSTKDKPQEEVPPQLMLSMLEYYLFLLIRYPLSSPKPKQPMTRRVGPRREPYGETVYAEVFDRTIRHFLPYGLQQSELFLRIVIALWIENQTQIEPTAKVLHVISDRNKRVGIRGPLSFDLDSSFDLVHAKFDPPYTQVQKCLRKLFVHLVCDPSLKEAVTRKSLDDTSHWCLGASMSALQQPLYNQIRTAFRHASIHASGSSFFSTFSCWLIWLEPWNVVAKRDFSPRATILKSTGARTASSTNTTLTIPAHATKSKYTTAWESYVAANLFMYIVPLAIFLRRARELDFSSGKCEGSIKLVQRAFRVFSPELVDTLTRLLRGQSNWSRLVERHREILGSFAPPPGPMAMQSLRKDMQSLLEEIQMQYIKKMRELDSISRMVNKVEHLFGQGVMSRDGKALDSLLASARIIVQFPLEFDMMMANGEGRNTSAHMDGVGRPERTASGALTAAGREQLLSGQVKCDPSEISYQGDKMRQPVMTYEVAILVRLTVWLSDFLNMKLGFDQDDTSRMFRFNLRFLADYRNLLFVFVVGKVAVLAFRAFFA